MAKDVMTVAEVQRALGLSRNGVYEAVKRGEISSIRIGRRILIPRLAYLELLQAAAKRVPKIEPFDMKDWPSFDMENRTKF